MSTQTQQELEQLIKRQDENITHANWQLKQERDTRKHIMMQYYFEKYRVELGSKVINTQNGSIYIVASISTDASINSLFRPQITGFKIKKNGEQSVVRNHIYNDWELE